MAQFAADTLPAGTLESICVRAGLKPRSLIEDHGAWVSHEQFEAVAAGIREALPDDNAFRAACAYRIDKGYGPIRFLLWAASPGTIYDLSLRTMEIVSTVSRYEMLSRGRTRVKVRYVSSRPESRLMCISRQAAGAALPTLWNLPPADLTEESCIAHGDDCCVFELRWADRPRSLGSLAGALAGAAILVGAATTHQLGVAAMISLPVMGAAIGYALELRRAAAANLEMREEQANAVRQIAADEAEARRELMALGGRQRDWTRMLEEAATERSIAMRQMADQLRKMHEAREATLRGFSHDLRTPLGVVKAGFELFRIGGEGDANERTELLDDVEGAVEQMRQMLEELMRVATSQQEILELAPTSIDVASIVDKLRRRLRALVHGRDIRVSVFRTREAPESIETDQFLFDRVVDNLLSNAAKYTERGSIIVEVDGSPTSMTLKLSDTGRGIALDALERSFTSGGSDVSSRAFDSYGVGLSVVVELLGLAGGRLEVMSKPGSGTTFWVHLPLKAAPKPVRQAMLSDGTYSNQGEQRRLSNVVTIRKVGNAP
jgi:signal transduction histidine kinase